MVAEMGSGIKGVSRNGTSQPPLFVFGLPISLKVCSRLNLFATPYTHASPPWGLKSLGSFKLKTKTDTSKGVFIFLIRKKHPSGDYKILLRVSKEGYESLDLESSFTVED